jgi:hypothetical protein
VIANIIVNRPLSTSEPNTAAPIALPVNSSVANSEMAVAR